MEGGAAEEERLNLGGSSANVRRWVRHRILMCTYVQGGGQRGVECRLQARDLSVNP